MDSAKKTAVMIFEELFETHKNLDACKKDIWKMFELASHTAKNGGIILVCGNGGSAADCEHIVGELMKGFMRKRALSENEKSEFINAGFSEISDKLQGAIAAVSLVAQIGIITAYANDVDPDMIFAQQVFGYRNPNNLLLAISTSGNSKNVLNAVKTAKALGIKTVGLLGKDGGEIAKIADCRIVVPENETYKIQEFHLPIYHAWCAMLEAELFE
jgi:D-sedoheptulose 7-phosphate isomerase